MGITKSHHAAIHNMEVGDIRFYKDRWRQINWLWSVGKALDFSFESDESEREVHIRWAKLKEGK
jgi:hypothetical protein